MDIKICFNVSFEIFLLGKLVKCFWNLARIIKEIWFVHFCFLLKIIICIKATLEEIILRRVRPGTHIITDCWAAYNGLKDKGDYFMNVIFFCLLY